MSYFESIQDLIGNTPLVKLTHLGLPEGASLFAKLELLQSGRQCRRTGSAVP